MEDTLGIYEGKTRTQPIEETGMVDNIDILTKTPFDEESVNRAVQTVIKQGKEPSMWDRFWKIFESPMEVQKARATVVLDLAERTGIAPHEFEPSYKDAIEEGFDNSIIGLLRSQKIPELQKQEVMENIPFAKRIAMQASTVAGDMPFMITGALIGAPGGAPAAMGGAFALPMGLRKVLIDKYSKGEINSAEEFLDRLWGASWATLKGEAIGMATGVAGKLAPTGLMAIPIETATMTVVGSALEGRIPHAQEFIDTALIIGGLRISTGIAGKLRNIYTEVGRRPIEVLKDIEQDVSIKDDIINPDREMPRAYEKLQEEEIKAQPIKKEAPKIIDEEKLTEKEPEVQVEERGYRTKEEAQKDLTAEGLTEETHQIVKGADSEWRTMPREPEFVTPEEGRKAELKNILSLSKESLLKEFPNATPEEISKKLDLPVETIKLIFTPDLEKPQSITAFTKEYKEPLGEGGFVKVEPDKETGVKVLQVEKNDTSKWERGLGSLHMTDRHPFIAPVIKMMIKAEQSTNHWILRKSDKIITAFDKVEGRGLMQKLLGREETDIRDLDLMIEGKKPVPPKYAEFIGEIKGILGEVKGEIIEKMKSDFSESLTPAQKKYLVWKEGGEAGVEPTITVSAFKYTNKKGKVISVGEHERPIGKATKDAVDEAMKQFRDMETWGITDYFPHIFKGMYKYLDSETGGIVSSGQTAKQAKAVFDEMVTNNPDMKGKTYIFVNDFYDLLTVRKSINPDLVNPLEYLGTRLSQKEFFRLVGKTEKLIKEEMENAGVDDVKGVKIDMSGIASMQKGTKFSQHFMKRHTEMRGEEVDPFRALTSYIFSAGRKLGLEDAKKSAYSFADSLQANQKNTKEYIKMLADNMSGRYNMVDAFFDETIGSKLGMKPFGLTRIIATGVSLESKLKLGYAPAKTAVNRVGGVLHTILEEGAKNYVEGKALLMKKDPYLLSKIETEGHLAGMEQLFAGERLIGTSQRQIAVWKPLGSYQKAEIHNRSEALAAAYVAGLKKFQGDKDAAWIYAIDSARLTQGLYNTAAKPVIIRGPIIGAAYQFKQYLTNEIRFMSQLTPKQWAGYIAGITAIAGTRGALLTIRSVIGISVLGMGIDNLAEKLNRKQPHLHRGIFGMVGIDVSAPASWQLPTQVQDWFGALFKDLYATGEMTVKGMKNNGWTDEQINDYVRQIAPVGYNMFKGFQMLSEGQTKEGSKVIYRGDKSEGVFNFMGAKTVKQSQASDSTRYMNVHRTELMEKVQVVEDKLFRSKNLTEIQDHFNELAELKNIQTGEEMDNMIRGLKRSAESRQLTEEARVFLTLPKSLKIEEIERRQP